MRIGVIGGDPCSEQDSLHAFEVGREIGRRGHLLITGGRGGVMREACRGAREAGGTTVGILPGNDDTEANEFVDIPIVTGLGHVRNAIVVRTSEALIAVGGRYGTLSEIAFALIYNRPIVGLGTWQLTDPAGDFVPVIPFETAAEAVDYCEQFAKE